MRTAPLAAFICVLSLSFCVCAQPPISQDERFVLRTAQVNLAEVQMSAWAKDHALSDEVQKFASSILNDHTVLADELRSLAEKESTGTVSDLDPKDAAELERMKTMEPNLLDREYMREVLKWHQKESDAFRREVEAGKDPALKYWAYQMLTKIQLHIRQGEDTERAIGMEVVGQNSAPAIVVQQRPNLDK